MRWKSRTEAPVSLYLSAERHQHPPPVGARPTLPLLDAGSAEPGAGPRSSAGALALRPLGFLPRIRPAGLRVVEGRGPTSLMLARSLSVSVAVALLGVAALGLASGGTPAAGTPGKAPPATPPAPSRPSACQRGMQLVDGQYCDLVQERCEKSWYDPANKKVVCERFASPRSCTGKRVHKRFCVDRYEWPNQSGQRPEVMNISIRRRSSAPLSASDSARSQSGRSPVKARSSDPSRMGSCEMPSVATAIGPGTSRT